MTIFFEYINARFNIDIAKFITGTLIGGFGLDLLGTILGVVMQQNHENEDNPKPALNCAEAPKTHRVTEKRQFQNHLDSAYQFIIISMSRLSKSRLTSFLLVCTLFLGIPAAAARYHACGKIINEVSIILYTDPSDVAYTDITDTDVYATSPTEITDPADTGNFAPTDQSRPEVQVSQGFLTDPKRYYELCPEEYNEIYFLSGPFAITDWTDTVNVTQTLTEFIKSLQCQNMPNSFDANAPVALQGEVSYASQLEIQMINSDDLDRIIKIRINAWDQYPKHSLATLLASNQQRYALEYSKVDGHFETIEYYYAQSIFWAFESLTFSNTNGYTIKNTLSSIKMRYLDIASTAPDNSRSKYYATHLFEAFESLENSYV